MNSFILEKVWYIRYNDEDLGPFALTELKKDSRISLETFIWRAGWLSWRKIKDVPEVYQYLYEETAEDVIEEGKAASNQALILELETEPSPFLFWALILLIMIAYWIYRHNVIA